MTRHQAKIRVLVMCSIIAIVVVSFSAHPQGVVTSHAPMAMAASPASEVPRPAPKPVGSSPPPPVRTAPFKVASFNLYGCTESPSAAGRVGGWRSCTDRVPAQWNYIQDHKFSVVGFSEVESAPFALLNQKATASQWAVYPTSPTFTYAMATVIGWDTKTWTLVHGSTFQYPMYEQRNGSYKPAYGVAIQLRNIASKATLWVMSVHNASPSSTKHQQAALRDELKIEADLYAAYAQHNPVLVLGDFNDGSNLTACAFKNAVADTRSAWGYPTGCGPQIGIGEPIDKIITHGFGLASSTQDWDTQAARLTDHGVPSALSVPGTW